LGRGRPAARSRTVCAADHRAAPRVTRSVGALPASAPETPGNAGPLDRRQSCLGLRAPLVHGRAPASMRRTVGRRRTAGPFVRDFRAPPVKGSGSDVAKRSADAGLGVARIVHLEGHALLSHTRPHQSFGIMIAALAVLAARASAQPMESVWQAAAGLRPDEVCPAWTLVDTAPGADPDLAGGELVLTTAAPHEDMFYVQTALESPCPTRSWSRRRYDSRPARRT
jgi:hypothetical protein